MASNGGGAKREEKGKNIQVVVRCRYGEGKTFYLYVYIFTLDNY